MNINTFEKEIQTKYTVKHIQFDENLTLYKIEIITGEKIGYQCGICLNSEIDILFKTPETFKSELYGHYLWNKQVIEACKTDFHQLYNDLEIYMIKINEIIDHIEDINDFEDFIVLKWDGAKEELYEYGSDNPIPKTVYFDYTSGNISNINYNLEEMLEILKNRKDIVIFKGNFGEEIQSIPYYNCDEYTGKNRFISFKWIPNNKDWTKICNMKYFKKYEYIITEIFNIKRIDN